MIMPESFDLDLATLIRIGLNDPSVRADVHAALAAGPLPVRDAVFLITEGDRMFAARLRTDRDKEPGQDGFLQRNQDGRLVGGLTEAMAAHHGALTMTAEELARTLGISPAALDERTKKEPKL